MKTINYHTIITHRPNAFVSWYITESGFVMTSGKSQTVEQARKESADYVSEKAKLAESCGYRNIRSTIEVINLS